DWLHEHDDPLGPFIRLQSELEPIRSEIETLRAADLLRAEERALSRYRRRGLGQVYQWTRDRAARMRRTFRPGFVEAAARPVKAFLERGKRLFQKCPALHELALYDLRGLAVADLAASPLLSQVRHLVLTDWLNPVSARRLANSPHLANVRSLTLWL